MGLSWPVRRLQIARYKISIMQELLDCCKLSLDAGLMRRLRPLLEVIEFLDYDDLFDSDDWATWSARVAVMYL